MTEFEIKGTHFGSRNSTALFRLFHDKQFQEFETSDGSKINLKLISTTKVDIAKTGEVGEDDHYSCYLKMLVLCKETNSKYSAEPLIISPTKSFRDFDYYHTSIDFTRVEPNEQPKP